MVKGLSEVPGGYLLYNDLVFKIFDARIENDIVSHQIGEIVEANKKRLLLQLKNGQIALLKVQKQGKSKMDYKSFFCKIYKF